MRIDRPTPSPVRTPASKTETASAPKNTVRAPATSSSATSARPGDRFEAPKAQGVAAPSTPNVSSNLPAEVPTGTRDYYTKRLEDFQRRNPGMTPPDYYLNYGQKYCDRFSSLTSKDLSPQGLAWRDRTLKALQEGMEAKRREDPAGFAQLERDPEAFKKFAYGTHPDAYVNSGLYHLPVQDLVKIGSTPDLKDLFTKDGVNQVVAALGKMSPSDAVHVAEASVKEAAHDVVSHLPQIHLPHVSLPW